MIYFRFRFERTRPGNFLEPFLDQQVTLSNQQNGTSNLRNANVVKIQIELFNFLSVRT